MGKEKIHRFFPATQDTTSNAISIIDKAQAYSRFTGSLIGALGIPPSQLQQNTPDIKTFAFHSLIFDHSVIQLNRRSIPGETELGNTEYRRFLEARLKPKSICLRSPPAIHYQSTSGNILTFEPSCATVAVINQH